MKALAKYNWHLSNLVAFIRLNLFVKIDLQLWLDKPFEIVPEPASVNNLQGVLSENMLLLILYVVLSQLLVMIKIV
jgi:hypothetical protein